MSVPNQKYIEAIHKEPCDSKNIYLKINIDAVQNATKLLKPSTFKIWMYFAKNQEGYEFELSSVAVCAYCNVSDKTYREGIKELIANRFLIQTGKNRYDFWERPLEETLPKNGTKIVCHTSTEIAEN